MEVVMNMKDETRRSRAGIRRFVVLVAGVTGLLALLAEPVQAGVTMQHCEPVRRR
jgi:hypothetical protein